MMRSRLAVLTGFLLATATAGPAWGGGVTLQPYAERPVESSPYLPGSPVWGSPYISDQVLGGVFYDGPPDGALSIRRCSPAPGVICSARRHACWTPTGIDRSWTARFYGLKS
jgi:hypothetical protein